MDLCDRQVEFSCFEVFATSAIPEGFGTELGGENARFCAWTTDDLFIHAFSRHGMSGRGFQSIIATVMLEMGPVASFATVMLEMGPRNSTAGNGSSKFQRWVAVA